MRAVVAGRRGCRATGSGRGARLPDQPGRHVPEGLDLGRGAHGDRPPDDPARARARRGRSARAPRAGELGRGARPRARTSRADPAAARPRRRRGVRRGRAHQREGLHAGQVRPGRAPHAATSTTTAGSACRRPQPVPTGPSASTAASPSRWPTSGGADAVLVVGSQPRRDDAATRPAPRRRAVAVGACSWSTPGASATARLTDDGAGIHLAPVPGTDLVVLLALTHVLVDEGLVDEEYVAERTTGWDAVRASVSRWWPERAEAVCGIPAAHAARDRAPARGCGPGARRAGVPTCSPAGASSSRTQGTDGVSAAINLALALGLPGRAGLRLRPAHRSGQRPGRSRARPEERPAARVPDDRRTPRPARTSPRCGAWTPTPSPARVSRPWSCCRGSARRAARERCSCTGPTPRSRPPTSRPCASALGRAGPARRRRLRALRDGPDGRRRAARDPVGRGGGHHDDPRGPRRAPPQGARPAR